MIRKYIQKLRSGMLRDIISETKWIYRYTVRYKGAIAGYILLGLAITAAGLGASVVSKYLIDAVMGHKGSMILMVGAAYLILGILRLLLSAYSRRVSTKVNIKVGNEIRAEVFTRFLDVDWQASLSYHSGDLLSRVGGDVATVAGSVLGWVPSLITGLVQLAATLAVILVYDPVMALLALASAPVTLILGRLFLKKMRSFGHQVRQTQAELTAFYEESLQNLQAVKAFNLKKKFGSRLDELQELYRDVNLDYNLFQVRINLLLSVVGFAVSSLCMGWGVYRLWSGHITFGVMLLFIQLASMVSSAFSGLVGLVPMAVTTTVAAGRVMTILSLPKENDAVNPEAAAVLENAPEKGVTVKAKNLSFAYQNGNQVFRNVNITAQPGEIIGIVSPSGGGKTTMIRMLLGLIQPDSGEITFESGGATAAVCPGLRSLVTYVAQEKVVFSGTIGDCLRMTAPTASEAELEQALRAACAWDFVSRLPKGIHTPLGERGAGLSEGQIQRLAIARALLSPAPLMLLDEATSALDLETERQVLSNILSGNTYRTVVVTTHRPTVLRSCARVYNIKEGVTELLDDAQINAMKNA